MSDPLVICAIEEELDAANAHYEKLKPDYEGNGLS